MEIKGMKKSTIKGRVPYKRIKVLLTKHQIEWDASVENFATEYAEIIETLNELRKAKEDEGVVYKTLSTKGHPIIKTNPVLKDIQAYKTQFKNYTNMLWGLIGKNTEGKMSNADDIKSFLKNGDRDS